MNNKFDEPIANVLLLACGSCRLWAIDVDESFDGKEWFLELDGPQSYLVFQLKDLRVIPDALRFLESQPHSPNVHSSAGTDESMSELYLGQFGSASVSLIWDDEELPRCFLVIGPKAQCAMRITLLAEDIEMLIDALGQVLKDLPEGSGFTAGNRL